MANTNNENNHIGWNAQHKKSLPYDLDQITLQSEDTFERLNGDLYVRVGDLCTIMQKIIDQQVIAPDMPDHDKIFMSGRIAGIPLVYNAVVDLYLKEVKEHGRRK